MWNENLNDLHIQIYKRKKLWGYSFLAPARPSWPWKKMDWKARTSDCHFIGPTIKLAITMLWSEGKETICIPIDKLRIFKPWAVTSSSVNDINIAHRVPRNAANGPKPIICRFVRRLTREVMWRFCKGYRLCMRSIFKIVSFLKYWVFFRAFLCTELV